MSFGTPFSVNCRSSDGKGESFVRYEAEVELWNHITTLDTTKRGPALVLRMAARAQEICIALETPKFILAGGVKEIMKELKASYAPDAPGAVYQDGIQVLRFRKPAETIDNYLVNLTCS